LHDASPKEIAMEEPATDRPEWWHTTSIYQIYPRSFQDSDRDGIGDLRGILRRLDYVAEVGVGTIWLSPIFRSPMADFGYDVSDYTDVDPLFGTLTDFDELLEAAHRRGLKLLLDLVPNHTSDRHSWFLESRSSRDNPKRDWYLWRDAKVDGGPPNNWLSEFGGSAWTFDRQTRQYYGHAFLAQQPDLNWRNEEVREAIHDVMRFWLERGVDGFRVDAVARLLKDEQFRDNPPNPEFGEHDPPSKRQLRLHNADLPELQGIIAGLRAVLDEFPNRLLIGEAYLPFDRLSAYYGRERPGAHFPFNFALLSTAWKARAIAQLVDEYEAALPSGAWPNWVLGNHDKPRIATRVGFEQARIAAMLVMTLRGTPTLYYGDEIGMQQVAVPPARVQDPFEKNVPGRGLGRDGARTPMQWDASRYTGFSETEPWLPLSDDFHSVNVANQREDATSIYHLYRRLIAARKARRSLQAGAYRPIVAGGELLLFARVHGRERMLVALNLGDEATTVEFRTGRLVGRVLVSAFGDRDGERVDRSIDLRGNEGLLIELSADADIPSSLL
jgi:alpha-glucosidase